MKPRVFSMGPLGSVVAIHDQGRPIVHTNHCFGKRKKRAGSTVPFCHQPL